MLRLGDIDGNPYIGVYCAASEELAVMPDKIDSRAAREIGHTLKVEVIKTLIAGSTVVGSLVAMNSRGIVVSNFAERDELRRFPPKIRVSRMEEKLNAAGNNILVNDHAALVHPSAGPRTVKMLEDTFAVQVERGSVAGIETVGSACIATSKGLVCHPRTGEDELKWLSGLFKVPASIATLNYGTPYLGACGVANSKGAYVGFKSTPIELGRIEDGLGLY